MITIIIILPMDFTLQARIGCNVGNVSSANTYREQDTVPSA